MPGMNLSLLEMKKSDIPVVKWQLKSDDVFIGGIVERCKFGYPRMILLDPGTGKKNKNGINYESISNIFWLTCPYLNGKIHDMENSGYIEKISKFIQDDLELKGLMNDANSSFYYLRKSIYKDHFGSAFSGRMMRVFDSGIGGIRDISSLKCLHIHFSHFRVCSSNVAGRLVSLLMKYEYNCIEEICAKAKKR